MSKFDGQNNASENVKDDNGKTCVQNVTSVLAALTNLCRKVVSDTHHIPSFMIHEIHVPSV